MTLKLSVLDQSFTQARSLAPQALQQTIAMAQHCEKLGFQRFWVSEHHAFPTLAGSAPEILLAALGAATQSIRLGSGGIMLPHYSSYKVAEVFSLLGNLYPGRIDLGVGRAPGADMSTAVALANGDRPKFDQFPQLLNKLDHYLNQDITDPVVSPMPPKDIPIWMLGSSASSAQIAAEKGLPYNLALFINPHAYEQLISLYKEHYQASAMHPDPYGIVTIPVFCCDTEEQAKLQQHTHDVNFYRFVSGQRTGPEGDKLLSPQQAKDFPETPAFQAFAAERKSVAATGTPQQVKEKIEKIADQYAADEVMLVTNMYDFENRKRSFQLVKEAFNEAVTA